MLADPLRPALLAALTIVAGMALAAEGDRQQPIKVRADHFAAEQTSGVTTLRGHVVIIQGTLEARADSAVARGDASGRTERIELRGSPAHLEQRMDDGSLLSAQAREIDYAVNDTTITLRGDAIVNQPGQGRYTGGELVYDPASGAIRGSGGERGRVHITLEPRPDDTP